MDIEKAKEKIKRNKRNKRGFLKGHKTYYDKEKGIVLIDEKYIKWKLALAYNKKFI